DAKNFFWYIPSCGTFLLLFVVLTDDLLNVFHDLGMEHVLECFFARHVLGVFLFARHAMTPSLPNVDLCRLIEQFGNDEKCRSYLEALRWTDGPICPACGSKATKI